MITDFKEVIEHYFARYGWSYHKYPKGTNSWVTGWQSDKRYYPLQISITETWVLFEIKPLIKTYIDWQFEGELVKFLLELNNISQFVKLSVDQDENINLSIQHFTENFSFEMFSNSLGILGYYSDLLYDIIKNRMYNNDYDIYPTNQIS